MVVDLVEEVVHRRLDSSDAVACWLQEQRLQAFDYTDWVVDPDKQPVVDCIDLANRCAGCCTFEAVVVVLVACHLVFD